MSISLMGAVNSIPARITLANAGVDPVTIPYFPDGTFDTLAVDTDGVNSEAVSSRVALIAGTTEGRDHFPFPVRDPSVSPPFPAENEEGGTCPIAMTLEDAMLTIWRVKSWRVTVGDITNHNTAPDETYGGFDYVVESSATVESDIVSFNSISGLSDVIEYEGGGLSYIYFQAGLDIGNAGAVFDSPNIHPGLSFGLYFQQEDDKLDGPPYEPTFDLLAAMTSYQSPAGSSAGTFSIVLPNGTLTTPMKSGDGGSWSVDVSIEPEEYWPYATKAALAVFNTSTGAEIRDPLS